MRKQLYPFSGSAQFRQVLVSHERFEDGNVVTLTKAKIRPDGDENHLSCECSTGCHVRFASHILRSPETASSWARIASDI